MLICSSPWLFAAYHVFLRLLVPRHPPCALFSLTFPPHSVVASGSWPFGLFFISVTWCFPHLNSHSGLASDVLYLWFYSRFKILFNIRFSRYNRILLCAKFIGNNSPCSLFLNGLLRSNCNAYFQWRLRDSNSRPPACKAGALPTELSPHLIRQPPAFPYRLQYSIIGRLGLNHRVRDENGCVP